MRISSFTKALFLRTVSVLGLAIFIIPSSLAQAQQDAAVPSASPNDATVKTSTDDIRYRIGPGDVLSIAVRKAPELSGSVRVDQRGMIRIPMVADELFAACHTESELAAQIKTLYLEYKHDPIVEIFVSDFQSRPVSVIGAVDKPGPFRLQRRVRLLEVISYAGGPTDKAGRVIDVIHTGGPSLCKNGVADGGSGNVETVGGDALTVFRLDETLKGKEGSNPFVQPGDIVSLPEADKVFVIGHVVEPKSIALKDKPITVSRAIAIAGGAARDGKKDHVRIIREGAGGEKQEMFVDLGAIQSRKAPDITLLPNDIVEVGVSTGKTILSILTGSASSVLANGVVRVIP